jgi:hypothetical protein
MYVTKFKASHTELGNISKSTIFYITKDNLVKLFESGNLESYQNFFFEKY